MQSAWSELKARLPVGELPDEPGEHESIPPIRTALHAYTRRLNREPDLGRLAGAVQRDELRRADRVGLLRLLRVSRRGGE